MAGLVVLSLSSCNNDEKDNGPAVQINSLSPTSGLPTSQVTLSGVGFSSTAGENKVTFNGKTAIFSSATV
jgi:hypothetical protein